VRTAVSLCWLMFMACNLGVMLFASAKLMTALIGLPMWLCIIVTAVLVGVYTFSGGLAAVVYTDVLQCIVMIVGCLFVVVMGMVEVGGLGAFREQVEALGPDRLSLVLPVDTPSPFPWPGVLLGLALILSPAYWIGNQAIVQRAFGAKSEFEAKASYVWGAVLKNVIPLIIAVPGLVAALLIPGLSHEDADQAIPKLVGNLLPAGLRGVFVAAFLAALMSSVDSYLNSASTLWTLDLYKRWIRPGADDVRLLRVGRIATVLFSLWAVLFAWLLMDVKGGIYDIFQTLMSFFQGPAFAVLMAGLLWRRATGVGALAGFGVGVLCAIHLYALNQPAVYEWLGWQRLFRIEWPYLYFSIWAFLAALLVLIVVSLCTRAEPEEKARLVVSFRPREASP
jgi:SSS family solute:Na+ symporter